MDSITKHMKNWRLILTLEKKVEIILLNTTAMCLESQNPLEII